MFASTGTQASVPADYVTSAQALVMLQVKPQTLYSYVSRGLVRRISPSGKKSFYHREDLQRLRARSQARSGHGPVAASAMHWGEPVLVTSITEITSEGPRYRQHLALDLVRDNYPFQALAEYLWTGVEAKSAAEWPIDPSVTQIAPQLARVFELYPNVHIRQLLTETVLLLSVLAAHRRDPAGTFTLEGARALIQAMCGTFGFLGPTKTFVCPKRGENVVGTFARALGLKGDAKQLRTLNAVLLLLADHEFTPGTFAARIGASAGGDLHSCVGAALQVQFGSALGLRCDGIEQALGGAAHRAAGMTSLTQGVFNHPLYTKGDPRAIAILDLALWLDGHAAAARATLETIKGLGDEPGMVNIDGALVVLCHALGIDKPVAGGLLALGRSAGWIAHVLEQREQDFMIRPRGKFTGALMHTDVSAA